MVSPVEANFAQRDQAKGDHRRQKREHRRHKKDERVCAAGRELFFKEQLAAVDKGLQESKGTDAIGTHAPLKPRADLALHVAVASIATG